MGKRVINKEDYPMVLDWDGYINTHTKLPCKCQACGEIVFKSINYIDHSGGDSYCLKCGNSIKKINKFKENYGVENPSKLDEIKNKITEAAKNKIVRENYPMVLDWSGYETKKTKLPCKCQHCSETFYRSLKLLDRYGSYCTKCANTVKKNKTIFDKYGNDLEEIKTIKRKQTNLDKYGVENPFQSEDIKEKIRQTSLKKYGTDNPSKSDKIKDKIKNIFLKKYGVEYNSQSEIIKNKKTESCFKKYGVTHPMQTKEVKEKIRQTSLKKYGVEHVFQSEEVKEKRKQNNLKKYGVEYPIKLEQFQNKRLNTCMKKYGTPHANQINRELWQIEVTSSKENFENYLKSFNNKKTTIELSNLLGFKDRSTILDYINKFDLWIYIDSISSTPEKELSDFINQLGFETQKKRFGWGEIDILITDKNIGFEFNGDYWHSDLIVNKNYHYNKVTNAQNEGIRLIHIWEHEWMNNRQYIESYIKAQLGLCEKRIFARKCEIKEIDFKTAKPLLEYHQQKATHATHYIGLYHENELVLAMLFSKVTKDIFTQNPVAEWEVKREICKEGYSVVGGKSKVFNYFLKTYNPQSVVSYVDRSKFTGKSYEIMGFKLDHINPARYDWVYQHTLIFKKRQPKIYKEMKKLYDEDKVLRIYDAGRYCYVWKKNLTSR